MSEISVLVEQFATDLEAIIRRRTNEMTARAMTAVRGPAEPKVRGVRKGHKFGPVEPRMCPHNNCINKTKARAYSFLCPAHRTAANLKKYKGMSK